MVELEEQRLVDEARQTEHQGLLTLFRKFAESTGLSKEAIFVITSWGIIYWN